MKNTATKMSDVKMSGADMEAQLMDRYFKDNARSGNPSCKPRTRREKKQCR